MNWDRVQGNWKQSTGKAMAKWGKLTNDESSKSMEIASSWRVNSRPNMVTLRIRQNRRSTIGAAGCSDETPRCPSHSRTRSGLPPRFSFRQSDAIAASVR
jgi:hypothetical protein